MERSLRTTNAEISRRVRDLRREIGREFGPFTRLVGNLLGPFILRAHRREERRLAAGVTYEPPTFLERRNWESAAPSGAVARTIAAFRAVVRSSVPALAPARRERGDLIVSARCAHRAAGSAGGLTPQRPAASAQ